MLFSKQVLSSKQMLFWKPMLSSKEMLFSKQMLLSKQMLFSKIIIYLNFFKQNPSKWRDVDQLSIITINGMQLFLLKKIRDMCNFLIQHIFIRKNFKHLFKKIVLVWKECNIVLQSSQHEEITFLHVFIFAFIPDIILVILSKMLSKMKEFGKNL